MMLQPRRPGYTFRNGKLIRINEVVYGEAKAPEVVEPLRDKEARRAKKKCSKQS